VEITNPSDVCTAVFPKGGLPGWFETLEIFVGLEEGLGQGNVDKPEQDQGAEDLSTRISYSWRMGALGGSHDGNWLLEKELGRSGCAPGAKFSRFVIVNYMWTVDAW